MVSTELAHRIGTRALGLARKRGVDTGVLLGAIRSASTQSDSKEGQKRERIVVLGSGWAGYALGRELSPKTSHRVLISPRSHFVFTPLLASTSVGTLELRAAIEPVRRLQLAEFHQAWAVDVDFNRKVVRVEPNTEDEVSSHTGARRGSQAAAAARHQAFDVPYDKLVLAVGCYSQTFGIAGVAEHACFLRDVGDARAIRLRVLRAFETAALPTTPDEERRKLLHFAVVGGGPTGIEFAGEMHDLIQEDLSRLYPDLMRHVAITIYDIAPKVLPMFDQRLADYATTLFRRQGIVVKTEHHLERIRREGDHLLIRVREEPDEVPAGLVVWSTGLMQNPLVGKLLDRPIDGVGSIVKDSRTGGFLTDANLRVRVKRSGDAGGDGGAVVTTLPDVYAVGDCAVVEGERYPATAQVASQQAIHLARRLNKGDVGEKPFRFRNWGTMAYLGSWRAIHQSKADELTGRAAWILWRTAYLTKSMSIRNKILIPVYWVITWIFGRDISRF